MLNVTPETAKAEADLKNEYLQFQQFRSMMRMMNSGSHSNGSSFSEKSSSAVAIPHHLQAHAPGVINAEQHQGFLSQQFPTLGNPAPLGLCGFALTTFVLSMFNVGADVATSGPQGVVFGLALF